MRIVGFRMLPFPVGTGIPSSKCVWVWVFSVGDVCVGYMWVMRWRMYWTVVLPICQTDGLKVGLTKAACVGRVYVSLVRTNEDRKLL